MSNTWGALSWNVGSWGLGGDQSVSVTGTSASFSIGEETISSEIRTGWGRLGWNVQSWGSNETIVDVSVTGMSMTSSIGEESADFEALFGVDKATFFAQPKWKRTQAKKRHGLF